MYKFAVSLVLVLVAVGAFADDPPPIVNGGGITLKDLAGKDQLVTVVLKGSNVMDRNLRVVDVSPINFSVVSPKGERTPYLFSLVAEVRLQEGTVESREFNLDENRTLRPDEQKILDRALERSRELFDSASSVQNVKIRAASHLYASGKKDAGEYLHKLAASNDVPTQVTASIALYLAGDNDIPKEIISQGLSSGDRAVRGQAALLAGLLNETSSMPTLTMMVRDRAAEICAPAARALARLGIREAIPELIKMLQLNDPVKGDAAVFALARLGGSDVIEEVKALLPKTSGQIRYRAIQLLYQLGDSSGKDLMVSEGFGTPTLQFEAAIVLAKEKNREAVEYLSKRLQGLYDDKFDVLMSRAKAAIALEQGVDPTAMSHLQKLLTSNINIVRIGICDQIAMSGRRKLLPILQPIIEDVRPNVSLSACGASLCICRSDFHKRFVETRQ